MPPVVEFHKGKKAQEWRVENGAMEPVARSQKRPSGIYQLLASAFLPVGYPESVTPDYNGFVAWNTVQAISSYVRGILSSHAVFKGVGVGSQAATALGAVFQFFVRDILGMVGGIMFAFAAGGNFDSNAKQWRLFADVMNDLAMALDLASPLIPGAFMLLASLGSVSRAMVGMAAGATHAALTQHFAAAGSNAADISAKAESRERACSIIGSLLGMAFTQQLADHVPAAWLFFVVLTVIHVWANVRALRCLVLSSLNEPRIKLLLSNYQAKEKVLTPVQVSALESLMVPPLAAASELLFGGRRHCAVHFGARLTAVLHDTAGAGRELEQLCKHQAGAADRQYIVAVTGAKHKAVQVVLHAAADQQTQLRAYLQALHLATALHNNKAGARTETELLADSQRWLQQTLPSFLSSLQKHGWELDKLFLPRPEWTAEW